MEEMTVHKALSSKKMLQKRITALLGEVKFCGVNSLLIKNVDGVSESNFCENAKSNYTALSDMIQRYDAITAALHKSNAITVLTVGSKTYTVAEAIAMKDNIAFKERLLKKMKDDYAAAVDEVETRTIDLERNADKYVSGMYANKDGASEAEIKKLREEHIKSSAYSLVNPLNLEVKIRNLQAEIDEFNTEIDSALAASNAVTIIKID